MLGRIWDGYKRVDPFLSFSGNIISFALWLGLPAGALMAYLSAQLGWFWETYQWAGVLGVGLITWFLVGVTVNLFRNVVGSRTINTYLIVAGIGCIVMVAALIGYSRSQAAVAPLTTNKSRSTADTFVKDAVVSLWLGKKEPLEFLATPTQTFANDRLRVLVEYSIYNNGWMAPVRFEVDPIREPAKGKRIRVALAHTGTKPNGGMEDLWWGTDPESANVVMNNPTYGNVPASLTRGRIVVIGPNNMEQNATYFEFVRGANDQGGNIRFIVLQGREVGDWISDWEKDS